MSATQFFPIPPEMFALACETVTRRVSRLPFLRSGVMVTGELVGVTMECLNAEFTKTLALRTPPNALDGSTSEDGLDRCLEERLKLPGKSVVPVITEVLYNAGIAEPAEILDKNAHQPRKGIRLLSLWTWHAASSMAQTVRLPGSVDGEHSPFTWMSMCPVCRTGVLNRIVGKQLFGIPRTDFIIECGHCGAKYIPVGTQFRLVSIATIRDPLWKKHLDKTYPPDTWAAIARGTGPAKTPGLKTIRSPASMSPRELPVGLPQLKKLNDGTFVIPYREKTLFFKRLKLQFSGGLKENHFDKVQKTLQEVLDIPVFAHLRDRVNAKYPQYLPLKTGVFLGQLKERQDPFYREFLNPYGDEKYGTFRLEDSDDARKNGVMIVVYKSGLYYSLNSPDSFSTLVNNRLGRVLADDCLLCGDSVRCRINALLSANKTETSIAVHTNDREEDRELIVKILEGYTAAGST
jgi:hypothetical protein